MSFHPCPNQKSGRRGSALRRATLAASALTALATLLLACSSSSDEADGSSGDSNSNGSAPTVSSAGLTPGAQDALEERHEELCKSKTGDTSSYEEWTLAEQRSRCERHNDCCTGEPRDCDDDAYGVPFISYIRNAMECGLNRFDRAAADRCLQNRTAAVCSLKPDGCDEAQFIIGTLKAGDPCQDGAYECGPGLYCDSGNVILGIGVCKPARALGEACQGANVCGPYYCDLSKDVCVSLDADLGCTLR